MKKDDVPKNELKRVYAEILRGNSIYQHEKYGTIYVKHLKVWDTEDMDERRDFNFKYAKEKGLPTNEEKIKLLERDEVWEPRKEKEIEELEEFVTRMKATKNKLILKSQVDSLGDEIKEAEEKVAKIRSEKSQLLGLTAEIYADKKANDFYVYLTLFKDAKLEVPLLSEEEYDELNDTELSRLIMVYNVVASRYSERNMKRVALSPFFLNNFYLCKDNPFIYFGKPVVELTYHQGDLFSYGRYFKHVLSEMKHQPSSDIMGDPDKLVELYDIEQNQEKMEQGKDSTGMASTYIGATKEDMKALGMVKDDSDPSVIDLNEEIAKAGGELSMEDMIKLHGV